MGRWRRRSPPGRRQHWRTGDPSACRAGNRPDRPRTAGRPERATAGRKEEKKVIIWENIFYDPKGQCVPALNVITSTQRLLEAFRQEEPVNISDQEIQGMLANIGQHGINVFNMMAHIRKQNKLPKIDNKNPLATLNILEDDKVA